MTKGEVASAWVTVLVLVGLVIMGKQGHQGVSAEPGAERMPRDTSGTGEWSALSVSSDWKERNVSRADMGDQWRFTVDEGLLRCTRGAVTFTSRGTIYAVNETALGRLETEPTWKHVREIWAGDPNPGVDLRRDMTPIIDFGLRLCT